MTWMTLEQFKAFVEQPKCSYCDKPATWLPKRNERDMIAYCDDHYPDKADANRSYYTSSDTQSKSQQ